MRHSIPIPISRGAVLALALVAASACATKNDVRDLQADLQAELREMREARDEFYSSLVATQDATQDATERELLDTRGEISRQLRDLTQEFRQLVEFTGQIQISVDNLADRIDRLERSGANASRPSSGSASGQPRDGLLAPGVGGDADADYATAMELYRTGQFFGAQAAFDDFLADHPNDELVPAVHLNLGDVHYRNGDPDAAIASLERVGELFPNAQEVVQAQYRIGTIHMEQDDDDAAREVFRRIINTWADDPSALAAGIVQDARDRLEELGG